MMFKEGTCPKCHEKIQVPEDREQIICMFCGEEIRVADALGEKKTIREPLAEAEYVKYAECAENGLRSLIRTCDKPMMNFKKNLYAGQFEEFYGANSSVFEAMDKLCGSTDNPEDKIQEMVSWMTGTANEELGKLKFKGHKTQKQMDYNFMISIYLVPAVRKYPSDFSEPFADQLLAAWNEMFSVNLGKASYEDIAGGFKRKLCYVTTAICESLGKEADCYELRLLKDYRDQYMESDPERKEMVDEYYDIAPTIVKRMDRCDNRKELYQDLYDRYLMPCIHEIEDEKYEECCNRYQDMVMELKFRYMN
ncbi:hypothetical protein KFE18_13285 [Clostridiaceae bacterium Marseille-Q4143]|nr:hypothetical protein KFE18_13285 [Clostridiaceae bacterium Marseille-Q4143]